MSEQVYPSVFALSSLQETRDWVADNGFAVATIVRRPFVMVNVEVTIGINAPVYGYGFAKCAAGDTWDEGVGIALARFRAERDATQQVHKHTLGGKLDGINQIMAAWSKEAMLAVKRFADVLKPFTDVMEKATK